MTARGRARVVSTTSKTAVSTAVDQKDGNVEPPNNIWAVKYRGLSPQVSWLYPKIGLSANAHLPEHTTNKVMVDGFWVRVLSQRSARRVGYFHRLFVTCPVCEREVPFGRLHQHVGKKDHRPC